MRHETGLRAVFVGETIGDTDSFKALGGIEIGLGDDFRHRPAQTPYDRVFLNGDDNWDLGSIAQDGSGVQWFHGGDVSGSSECRVGGKDRER